MRGPIPPLRQWEAYRLVISYAILRACRWRRRMKRHRRWKGFIRKFWCRLGSWSHMWIPNRRLGQQTRLTCIHVGLDNSCRITVSQMLCLVWSRHITEKLKSMKSALDRSWQRWVAWRDVLSAVAIQWGHNQVQTWLVRIATTIYANN